jgi:hypothetical protein
MSVGPQLVGPGASTRGARRRPPAPRRERPTRDTTQMAFSRSWPRTTKPYRTGRREQASRASTPTCPHSGCSGGHRSRFSSASSRLVRVGPRQALLVVGHTCNPPSKNKRTHMQPGSVARHVSVTRALLSVFLAGATYCSSSW